MRHLMLESLYQSLHMYQVESMKHRTELSWSKCSLRGHYHEQELSSCCYCKFLFRFVVEDHFTSGVFYCAQGQAFQSIPSTFYQLLVRKS